MPSDIVVTNPTTLQENFANNAQEIFCNVAFQAGGLATGAGLLFFTPFATAGALALGAGLAAMTHCPNGGDPEVIFGGPPDFEGGQCEGVSYQVSGSVSYYVDNSGSNTDSLNFNWNMTGPVRITQGPVIGWVPFTVNNYLIFNDIFQVATPFGIVAGTLLVNVVRNDGQPDDCGNPPGDPPPQIIRDPENGDQVDQDELKENDDATYVVPIDINVGDIDTTINMPFSNPQIKAYVPIKVSFNVGGVVLDFGPQADSPDWEVKNSGQPLMDEMIKDLYDRLAEVKDCVCSPPVELDMLTLPAVVENEDGCIDVDVSMLAARGTYPPTIVSIFDESKALAEKGCDEPPPNVPRSIIMSGTSSANKQVFTSDVLDPEIKVIEFEVTSFGPDTRLYIAGNENVPQGRFGVLFVGYFDTDGSFYAGEGFAQYYQKNLIVVPPELSSSLGVRVSMPLATNFNIWDTGLRS